MFVIFVIFGYNLRHFHYKERNKLFKRTTGQPTVPLLTLQIIPLHEVCRTFDQKCVKTLKNGKTWEFCHFRRQFDIFSLKSSIYLFVKAHWSTK